MDDVLRMVFTYAEIPSRIVATAYEDQYGEHTRVVQFLK